MHAMTRRPPSAKKAKRSTSWTNIVTQMKKDFERRNGLSFANVQVHFHSSKPAKVGAVACIQGADIDIASGYEWALPHELGHYPQQALGLSQATCNINGLPVDASPERERDANRRCWAVQNGTATRSAAVLPHLNTVQLPIQRLKDNEFNELVMVYARKYFSGYLWHDKLEMAKKDCEEALKTYWSFFHDELDSAAPGMSEADIENEKAAAYQRYIAKLDYFDAFEIIRGWRRRRLDTLDTSKPRTIVVTFGDQGLETARHAQKSGFCVIATSPQFDFGTEKVDKRLAKINRTTEYDPQATVQLYENIELDDLGNAMDTAENKALPLPLIAERREMIAAFDHPYTTGVVSTHYGSNDDVKALCNSFFQFTRKNGIGRAQMTVRAVNAGERSTLGIYELAPQGFSVYRVQRAQSKKHIRTNSKGGESTIKPRDHSLLFKFVNIQAMFPKLISTARNIASRPDAYAEENTAHKADRSIKKEIDSFRAAFLQAVRSRRAPYWLKRMESAISFEQKYRLKQSVWQTPYEAADLPSFSSDFSFFKRLAVRVWDAYQSPPETKADFLSDDHSKPLTGADFMNRYASRSTDEEFSD